MIKINPMQINDLPLRDLFDRLREVGFILGIDDYQRLLQSLMAGFGLADTQALARLCKTLWVKSQEESEVFDYYFNDYFARGIAQPILQETVTSPQAVTPNTEDNLPPKPPKQESKPITDSSASPNSSPSPSPNSSPSPSLSPSPNSSPKNKQSVTKFTQNFSPDPDSDFVPEICLKIQDEVQVAKNQQRKFNYLLFADYLPVTGREMKQTWRYLRRTMRQGPKTEIDVVATIEQISQQGFFLNPVLVPRRVNRVELVLLLDIDGSMVAFHGLGDRIKETAIRGGRLGRSQVYYFHNCPVNFLYRDRAQLDYLTIEKVLDRLSPIYSCVLIFSDAGAARGGYSEERIELTENFIRQLQQKLRYLAWLNPVPQDRWSGTTAGKIAQFIPMFECDKVGLKNAIKVLRGNSMVNGY